MMSEIEEDFFEIPAVTRKELDLKQYEKLRFFHAKKEVKEMLVYKYRLHNRKGAELNGKTKRIVVFES